MATTTITTTDRPLDTPTGVAAGPAPASGAGAPSHHRAVLVGLVVALGLGTAWLVVEATDGPLAPAPVEDTATASRSNAEVLAALQARGYIPTAPVDVSASTTRELVRHRLVPVVPHSLVVPDEVDRRTAEHVRTGRVPRATIGEREATRAAVRAGVVPEEALADG